MDNQHRKIAGYRELTEAEIALMNEIKALGVQMEALVVKLQSPENTDSVQPRGETLRWISIGQTHLQQGLMALTRSVAKPLFF